MFISLLVLSDFVPSILLRGYPVSIFKNFTDWIYLYDQ